MSYTFYNKGQNAYKSACDGVVIYAQNWKHLLKNAAMTALTVIVSILVVTLVAFVLFGGDAGVDDQVCLYRQLDN